MCDAVTQRSEEAERGGGPCRTMMHAKNSKRGTPATHLCCTSRRLCSSSAIVPSGLAEIYQRTEGLRAPSTSAMRSLARSGNCLTHWASRRSVAYAMTAQTSIRMADTSCQRRMPVAAASNHLSSVGLRGRQRLNRHPSSSSCSLPGSRRYFRQS